MRIKSLLLLVVGIMCFIIDVTNSACVTDSNSLMIMIKETMSGIVDSSYAITKFECASGEVSDSLYWMIISGIASWEWTPQTIFKVTFNGITTPTFDWAKYFSMSTYYYNVIGVMHNEKYVFSAQFTTDSYIIKLDTSNGNVAKIYKVNSVYLGDTSSYSHILIDTTDSYLFVKQLGNNNIYMLAIETGTITGLTSTVGIMFNQLQITGAKSIYTSANVVGTWDFKIGKLNFEDSSYQYKTMAIAGSWTGLSGRMDKDASEDVIHAMLINTPKSYYHIRSCLFPKRSTFS